MNRFFLYNIDWWLISLVSLVMLIGLFTVFSASNSLGLDFFYLQRQLVWIGLGVAVLLITLKLGFRFFCRYGIFFHLVAILLLLITLAYGTGNNFSDVRRWLRIGPFTIQASELAKLTAVITLSYFFKESSGFGKFGLFRILLLLLIIGLPFFLIVKQPDLGSAMLFLFTCLAMVFYGGLPYKWIVGAVLLVGLLSPVVWEYGLKDYQKDRILTVIQGAEGDKLGKGYHINQSVIAVGSGGVIGKGYLQGSQAQLDFLPARHTDFIFALFSEEWGFFGSFTLLMLYMAIIFTMIKPVGTYKYAMPNLVTVGITTIIASHILINISMVIELFPVVGVPLPFFSYGGSAMISMMFGLGLVLSIRSRRVEEIY